MSTTLADASGTAAEQRDEYDLVIVGAGACGVGCGVMAKVFGIDPARTLIVERSSVGSTFDQWPAEMRFITPSFNQQAFGFMDLNSVAFDTSPAQLVHEEHPTGPQYAEYLREVARIYSLPVECEMDVTAVTPIGGDDGFEVCIAHNKRSATIRAKFVIWAAGEFQYPRNGGFPGAAEHCLHNSRVSSWAKLARGEGPEGPRISEQERVVIGGYESGMDAAFHLANAGVRVTVIASTPYWSTRTLDPSTELAPFTAARLKIAQAGRNPPTLLSHSRVVSVEKDTKAGGGYVVTAERTNDGEDGRDDEADGDGDQDPGVEDQSTVLVGTACGVAPSPTEEQDTINGDSSDSSASESESESESESGTEASDESDSEDDGVQAGSESAGGPELAVDQHGRVVAQLAAKCYRFRSFNRIFSKKAASSLRADCRAMTAGGGQSQSTECSDPSGETHWIGAGDTPRCSIECAALDIFRFHTGVEGCSFEDANSGAEWRVVAIDADILQAAWYWNKDDSLEQSGVNISPHLSTVTHLSDGGAPILIIDKACPTEHSADISGQAHGGLLSRPQCGKHVVFDGRYLHATPRELSLWGSNGIDKSETGEQQVILLVNIWLNWKPRDAVRCPDTVLTELEKNTVQLNFDHELSTIPTVPVNDKESSVDTIEWQFEAAKQIVLLTFSASLDSIRRMGTDIGASLLLQSWSEPKAKSIGAASNTTDDTEVAATTAAPEIVRVRTLSKPILATGFHSGVAKTVNHLFEWTAESLCAVAGADTSLDASASEVNGHGTIHKDTTPLTPDTVMPAGDPKLTKCDESTICPGLFLCGPQVRQDNQIFCFVYKYRQRFAVVMNEIATRLGLETEKVVAECRKRHMFLDDMSGCEATCGSSCKPPGASEDAGQQDTMESDCPLVQLKATTLPKQLKKHVAEDLRTRGLLVNKAQEALAEAIASEDLKQMAELLDAGLAQVQRTSVVTVGTAGGGGDFESYCWAPLHFAAHHHTITAVKFLLERGADPGFTAYRNEMSLTPLMLAVRSSSQDALRERSPDLVNLLIEHGADPDQTGPGGCTALHIACDIGFEKCAVALVQAGCSRQVKDVQGLTAKQVAIANDNKALVATLSAAIEAYEDAAANTARSATSQVQARCGRGGKRKNASSSDTSPQSKAKRGKAAKTTGSKQTR